MRLGSVLCSTSIHWWHYVQYCTSPFCLLLRTAPCMVVHGLLLHLFKSVHALDQFGVGINLYRPGKYVEDMMWSIKCLSPRTVQILLESSHWYTHAHIYNFPVCCCTVGNSQWKVWNVRQVIQQHTLPRNLDSVAELLCQWEEHEETVDKGATWQLQLSDTCFVHAINPHQCTQDMHLVLVPCTDVRGSWIGCNMCHVQPCIVWSWLGNVACTGLNAKTHVLHSPGCSVQNTSVPYNEPAIQ